jgi:hypothetical protein
VGEEAVGGWRRERISGHYERDRRSLCSFVAKAIDRSGLPADEAVKVFLEAWGPTMCTTRYSSDALVDLTKKNEHLRVTLQIELPIASGNVVNLRSKNVERGTKIIVGKNEFAFEIDYKPRYIQCRSPNKFDL